MHCARVFVPKVSVAHCFRHLSGRSFGTLLLSIRCISRPIRRRYRFGRRPRAHISQGCARCKESGPDRLGHSPASGPVAPGRTRVGARPPSCGAARYSCTATTPSSASLWRDSLVRIVCVYDIGGMCSLCIIYCGNSIVHVGFGEQRVDEGVQEEARTFWWPCRVVLVILMASEYTAAAHA